MGENEPIIFAINSTTKSKNIYEEEKTSALSLTLMTMSASAPSIVVKDAHSLFINKRFALNEMFQQNPSKFAIF